VKSNPPLGTTRAGAAGGGGGAALGSFFDSHARGAREIKKIATARKRSPAFTGGTISRGPFDYPLLHSQITRTGSRCASSRCVDPISKMV